MINWLEHPTFVPVRDRVIAELSNHPRRRTRPVVFLCGGFDRANRATVKDLIERNLDGYLVVYAEDVWKYGRARLDTDLLSIEHAIGGLADAIIIIVESAGSIAELGAFASVEALREKLLLILDLEHENAASFIRTGPVELVGDASVFGKAIYGKVSTKRLLETEQVIVQRLRRAGALDGRPPRALSPKEGMGTDWKWRMYQLCDLIDILQVVPQRDLHWYASQLAPDLDTDLAVPMMISTAESLKLVKCDHKRRKAGAIFTRIAPSAGRHYLTGFDGLRAATLRMEVRGAISRIADAEKFIGSYREPEAHAS